MLREGVRPLHQHQVHIAYLNEPVVILGHAVDELVELNVSRGERVVRRVSVLVRREIDETVDRLLHVAHPLVFRVNHVKERNLMLGGFRPVVSVIARKPALHHRLSGEAIESHSGLRVGNPGVKEVLVEISEKIVKEIHEKILDNQVLEDDTFNNCFEDVGNETVGYFLDGLGQGGSLSSFKIDLIKDDHNALILVSLWTTSKVTWTINGFRSPWGASGEHFAHLMPRRGAKGGRQEGKRSVHQIVGSAE
mmetsp:Transcript_1719/g.3264  ORF Transcript_1719/g.3264 Transcript_1719/m.3264 type:complete len:250 (-) Transcript_1719:1312-2061(-)